MAAEPYTDVSAHVRDELRRVWLRLEYQIRLGWRKELTEDVVGPEDMGRLFAIARGTPAASDTGADELLKQWLALHEQIEARIAATKKSPLVDVIRTFGLTSRQWGALMFALLPEVDPNLVQAYRYLARDPSCRGLDGRLLAQLVYDTPQTRSLMARDLSPSSPLLRYRLFELSSGDSLMFRRIRAAPRLVYLLDGNQLELDPELTEVAELRSGVVTGAFPAVAVDRATAALHSNEGGLAGQTFAGRELGQFVSCYPGLRGV